MSAPMNMRNSAVFTQHHSWPWEDWPERLCGNNCVKLKVIVGTPRQRFGHLGEGCELWCVGFKNQKTFFFSVLQLHFGIFLSSPCTLSVGAKTPIHFHVEDTVVVRQSWTQTWELIPVSMTHNSAWTSVLITWIETHSRTEDLNLGFVHLRQRLHIFSVLPLICTCWYGGSKNIQAYMKLLTGWGLALPGGGSLSSVGIKYVSTNHLASVTWNLHQLARKVSGKNLIIPNFNSICWEWTLNWCTINL